MCIHYTCAIREMMIWALTQTVPCHFFVFHQVNRPLFMPMGYPAKTAGAKELMMVERTRHEAIYIYFIAAVSFDFICILIHGERKGRKINQYHTSWNGYKYSKNKYMIVHAGGKLQVFGKCLVFRAIDHVYPSLLSALRDLAACNWPAAWGAGSKLSFESTTRKSYLKCDDGIIFTSKCKR